MSQRYAGRPVEIHDLQHFRLNLQYDPLTRETTRTWVYQKEKVAEANTHLFMPKAKSSGEKASSLSRPPPCPHPHHLLTPSLTPVVGTRYCQHIHAYVPENLPYKFSGLATAQTKSGSGSSVGVDIRVVPAKDGGAVRAEGLTHHQAKLISLDEAQKDVGIKYRSLTQAAAHREDLVCLAYAQTEQSIKYRGLSAVGM
ncbi:hypothetical protein C8Q80DRAFT_1098018 [Daedaleopsis nitida]|nr:hypothetical protein C8Q80DRAFT_1098018 [Daedaleopsis nitida]